MLYTGLVLLSLHLVKSSLMLQVAQVLGDKLGLVMAALLGYLLFISKALLVELVLQVTVLCSFGCNGVFQTGILRQNQSHNILVVRTRRIHGIDWLWRRIDRVLVGQWRRRL